MKLAWWRPRRCKNCGRIIFQCRRDGRRFEWRHLGGDLDVTCWGYVVSTAPWDSQVAVPR